MKSEPYKDTGPPVHDADASEFNHTDGKYLYHITERRLWNKILTSGKLQPGWLVPQEIQTSTTGQHRQFQKERKKELFLTCVNPQDRVPITPVPMTPNGCVPRIYKPNEPGYWHGHRKTVLLKIDTLLVDNELVKMLQKKSYAITTQQAIPLKCVVWAKEMRNPRVPIYENEAWLREQAISTAIPTDADQTAPAETAPEKRESDTAVFSDEVTKVVFKRSLY